MNEDRLDRIATWLEAGGKENGVVFDMRIGYRTGSQAPEGRKETACGTACCIAGAAVQFFHDTHDIANLFLDRGFFEDQSYNMIAWGDLKDVAEGILSLDYDTATALFEPHIAGSHALYYYNNPAWAARVIRKLIETGEVDWKGTEHID